MKKAKECIGQNVDHSVKDVNTTFYFIKKKSYLSFSVGVSIIISSVVFWNLKLLFVGEGFFSFVGGMFFERGVLYWGCVYIL